MIQHIQTQQTICNIKKKCKHKNQYRVLISFVYFVASAFFQISVEYCTSRNVPGGHFYKFITSYNQNTTVSIALYLISSACLSVSPFVCQSVCPSVRPLVCLCTCVQAFLCVFLYLCLSVCISSQTCLKIIILGKRQRRIQWYPFHQKFLIKTASLLSSDKATGPDGIPVKFI